MADDASFRYSVEQRYVVKVGGTQRGMPSKCKEEREREGKGMITWNLISACSCLVMPCMISLVRTPLLTVVK